MSNPMRGAPTFLRITKPYERYFLTDSLTLAVFGAGGKTGTLVLEHAVRSGHHVRGLEHHLPDLADRIEGVDYIQCDVLEDDLAPSIEGCDAVISALGVSFSPSTAIDPPPLYTDGMRRIVEAMGEAKIDRIAGISAAFVDRQPSVPSWFQLSVIPALSNILEHMRAMERLLEDAHGLRWTAVRPISPPFFSTVLKAEHGSTRSPRSESRKHMIRRACSLCAKNLKTCLRMLYDHDHFPYLLLLQVFR